MASESFLSIHRTLSSELNVRRAVAVDDQGNPLPGQAPAEPLPLSLWDKLSLGRAALGIYFGLTKHESIAPQMKIIETIISTERGWLVRQALKYSGYGLTALTVYLAHHGFALTDPSGFIAAGGAIAAIVSETALSKLASPIAATK